jgi:hypothetical protein
MPVWGRILLSAFLSALTVGAVLAIVRATHRLPAREPLHGNSANIAAPLPLDTAAADELTARELDAEQTRETPVR